MRDLIDMLDKYKESNTSIESIIFEQFIVKTTNESEKNAIFLIFKEFWFFQDLDFQEYETLFTLKEINPKSQKVISSDFARNSVIITKEDIYSQFFLTYWIEDKELEKYSPKRWIEQDEYSNEEKTSFIDWIIEWVGLLDEILEEFRVDIDTTYEVLAFVKTINELDNEFSNFSGKELEWLLAFINWLLNSNDREDFILRFNNRIDQCN